MIYSKAAHELASSAILHFPLNCLCYVITTGGGGSEKDQYTLIGDRYNPNQGSDGGAVKQTVAQ